MNITKRTKFAQDYLRDKVALNLLSRNWKMILADEKIFICSLDLDLNTEPTYYVFVFDEKDNVIKLGKGFLEGGVIKLDEIKLGWRPFPLTDSEVKHD